MKTLEVLSLGGGTQSSALLLMSCAGVLPKLDACIFADTQGEMDATYEHLEYLRGHAEAADIPFIITSKGSLYDDIIDRAGMGMQPNPPVRVRDEEGKLQRINSYFCSYDYKRRVVTAEVKKLCGPRGHPVPPRSACWFCPNRGNSHWRELRRDHPQKWQWVVSLDEFVRTGLNGLKGEAFIHQSGIPIKDVDFGDELDESSVAYDCDAGVCFT